MPVYTFDNNLLIISIYIQLFIGSHRNTWTTINEADPESPRIINHIVSHISYSFLQMIDLIHLIHTESSEKATTTNDDDEYK